MTKHAEYEKAFLEAELSETKNVTPPSIQLPVDSTVLASAANNKAEYPRLIGSDVDQFRVELQRLEVKSLAQNETEEDVKALGIHLKSADAIPTLPVAWLHPLELFVDEHIFRARDFERAICVPLYWKSLADPAGLPTFSKETSAQPAKALDLHSKRPVPQATATTPNSAPTEWSTSETREGGFNTALLLSKDTIAAAMNIMMKPQAKAYVKSLLDRVVKKLETFKSPMMAMYLLLFVRVWGDQLSMNAKLKTMIAHVVSEVQSVASPLAAQQQQTAADLAWDDLQQLVQLTIQFLWVNVHKDATNKNEATITYLVRSWRDFFGVSDKDANKPEYTFCTKILEPRLYAAYQWLETKKFYKASFNPAASRVERALKPTGWITSTNNHIVSATRNNNGAETYIIDTSIIYKDAKTGQEYISFCQDSATPTKSSSSAVQAVPSAGPNSPPTTFLCDRLNPAPLFCRREYSVVLDKTGKYFQAGPSGQPLLHWEDKDIVTVFNDGKSWPASFVNLVLSTVPQSVDKYPDHVKQLPAPASAVPLPLVSSLPVQYTRRWYKTNAGIELAIDTDHHLNSKSVFRFVFAPSRSDITLIRGWLEEEKWVIQSTVPNIAKPTVIAAKADVKFYKAVAPYIWECDKQFLVAGNQKDGKESFAMVVQGRQHVVDLVPLKWGGVDVDTANLLVLEDVAAILTSAPKNTSTGLLSFASNLFTSKPKNPALEYASTHLLRRYFFLKPNDTSLLPMYERKAEDYQMHSSLFSQPFGTSTKEDTEVDDAQMYIATLFDRNTLMYKGSASTAPTESTDQFYADWISRPVKGTDRNWTRLDLLWANRGRLYQEQQRVIQTHLQDEKQNDYSRKEFFDTTWKLWDLVSARTDKKHRTVALYECLSGRLVRTTQYATFRAIVEQVDDPKEQTIQHLLMGGGKTAVITPMLVLDRYVKMMEWYWLQQTRLPRLVAEIKTLDSAIKAADRDVRSKQRENQSLQTTAQDKRDCLTVIEKIITAAQLSSVP
jgi:hypothetical protein